MMWIVRLALRRPYTIAVLALLILIMGILSIRSMFVDIFPVIDIPVVVVVWSYPGLSADDIEKRIVFLDERAISTTVNGISKIESSSIPGIGLLKVYFEPGADIGAAIAQMTAVSSTALHSMPPGMTPPVILQYNATNLPVSQLTLSSKTLSEEKIFDYGLNFIRLRLFTIPGLSTPAPFGGKNRQIMIDIDPAALAAKGLSPNDVLNAIQTSNLIIPAGTARMGQTEFNIELNSSPDSVALFNQIPIRVVNGQPVLLGDVAKAEDSYAEQTNIVRVNRNRAAYLTILKKANSSTLVVVDAAKKMLPVIKQTAPEGLDLKIDFDQSVFVRDSIKNVLKEAIIASILVSLMILIFLGSWRSVIIVCTSIPLSILVSIICTNLYGGTLNIMTLGGLSLAIGMLVDDATVEIENIHRNRAMNKPITVAILDGASQVATPAIVATLAICIVFFPVVLLKGPAKFLFTPLALSVVVAMMASYLLSRTLVPTLARMLLENEPPEGSTPIKGKSSFSKRIAKFNTWRNKHFERLQKSYEKLLDVLLVYTKTTIVLIAIIFLVSLILIAFVGTDFFPATDSGMMKIHFRAPTGTRIEVTEQLVDSAEARIQKIIPPDELETIDDNIGIPVSYNLAFVNTDNTCGMDAEITISLKKGHKPTLGYVQKIRKDLQDNFPGCQAYFQSADIVNQVLNFGLSAPVDVKIEFPDYYTSYTYAKKLRDEMKLIPGLEDVVIKQIINYPAFKINIDRVRTAEVGLTEKDVVNDMLISLSSSSTVAPSFFIDPSNGVNYPVAVQTNYQKINSLEDLMNTPITVSSPPFVNTIKPLPTDLPMAQSQTLKNLAQAKPISQFNLFTHYTVQRVMNVDANVEGRDLGSVSNAIEKDIKSLGKLPKGMKIDLQGQSEIMHSSFNTLGLGLILAIALVYLLMVILFQSWIDPFIIMLALPGAFMGILWMLVITGTTINVESLMGSIVAIGIAVSNSILLVSFANDVRVEKNTDSSKAALEAGKTRLRPVLMTALAMVLGMLPMAIGASEGGEQNAPLGRAIIGGLLVATLFTLFVVPVFYSILRKDMPEYHNMDVQFEKEAKGHIEN
ncbi:MAG TPA: efflux RND transporter permease subunit [Bacteroidia bacterium]|nr:efflux RND transporter permease subunit [Bacteroidia bacterium]